MKKFLKNILFFVIPIFFFAYIFDVFISNQLKKDNSFAKGENSTWNDLYSGNIDSEIVIYGSSRAWVHIDPFILENNFHKKTYNLGIDGHNFLLQYLRHKTLIKNNSNPKYIILSLDVFSFSKNKSKYNFEQFLPYMFFDFDIIKYTTPYNYFSYLDYFIPFFRYVGQKKIIKNLLVKKYFKYFVPYKYLSYSKPYRIKGFKGIRRSWNNDLEVAKNKNQNFEIELDPKLIELFTEFINECKELDVKVVFVYTPEYIEGQNFVKNRHEIVSIFDDFSKNYKIPFLNYTNDTLCLNKQYFYNASHLNMNGAEIFTKNLVEDLKWMNFILQ